MRNAVYYVNDNFVEKPVVSLEDRGFFFADSVYEVIRAKDTRTYFFDEHLERLRRGLSEIKISLPYTDEEIKEISRTALHRLNVEEAEIYIQVTRGREPRKHMPDRGLIPTFVLIAYEFNPLSREILQSGVSLMLYEDIRWGRCDIKTTMLLPNVLGKMEAKKQGFFDALFHKNGVITESTSSSFFALSDGRLITHPRDTNILPSITRAKVIEEIAPTLGIKVEERPLKLEELNKIDGAFLAGTTYDILPVNRIENISINIPDTVIKIQKEYFSLVYRSLK